MISKVGTGTRAKHRKKATSKQLIALQLINQGMNKRQAMLKAGYSKGSADNPKENLMQSQAITSIVDKFQMQLADEGITTAYLAGKFKEWLDAQMKGNPDYHTQLEAAKMLKDIYNITPKDKEEDKGLKSRKTYTLEEFISPDVKEFPIELVNLDGEKLVPHIHEDVTKQVVLSEEEVIT